MTLIDWLIVIKFAGGLVFGGIEYGLVRGGVDPDDNRYSKEELKRKALGRGLAVFALWPILWP